MAGCNEPRDIVPNGSSPSVDAVNGLGQILAEKNIAEICNRKAISYRQGRQSRHWATIDADQGDVGKL
jgi:hypothetical protein